ncbi:Helicase PriA essential for oriC/DnaA-independent DNA replication [Alloactinosynnema sp. L-07]|uniref:primosomal protein N' n=1 Tax=Alloactinosynnema sp. L-07 TaxID=1653480 RepID=UPI00065F0B0B|nr:primosomal protein N' [Alloactinosynnema sp. L-07]CRK58046.1 Helicase PriA essential for oriC/DnaA-independent DNA replication [Alloactinosynnema sp. L-07]
MPSPDPDALFQVAVAKKPATKGKQQPAAELPVAKVYVDVPLAHLDRTYDYLVPDKLDAEAVPGCRIRVRFAGQLVDGYLIERVAESDHPGTLQFLDRVTSPEPVLAPDIARLCRAVADRYAGTMIDVLRLAIPPRHARVEAEDVAETAPRPSTPDSTGWSRYPRGAAFLDAVRAGRQANAVWQALPGEDWPTRLAEVAATAASAGKGAVIVVPDHRDVTRVHAACAKLAEGVVALSADLGPAKRYRGWLSIRRGVNNIVVGTRASAYAPVADPGVVIVWDDGDDQHSDPRSPYPHVRDVLIQRGTLDHTTVLVAGFARTAEAQLLVDSGWAPEIVATRDTVRAAAPRVTAIGEHDSQLARDPAARTARVPSVAFDAARAALSAGHPVLVQVPRRGYAPSLTCQDCRTPARCRRCAGPLHQGSSGPPSCRWCAAADANYRCPSCGSRRLRAVVIGAKRTAEELGRAFAGFPVRTSGGSEVLATVSADPAIVVATPGAEPVAEYGAALLLDAWALLNRADLRATEEALRRWMTAAALVRPAGDGGRVVVMAESATVPVQALVRWDPVWHAQQELAARTELGFPPAVRMASVDGTPSAVDTFLGEFPLPPTGEILGPVPLGEPDNDGQAVRERALLRVTRAEGRALAAALAKAQAVRTARKEQSPLRVQLDPLDLV